MGAINEFLKIELISVGEYHIRILTLVTILLVILITYFILFIIRITMFRKFRRDKSDIGNAMAIYQIIKYAIWVIAIGVTLNTIGIRVTVLIAGSAALLVGIGLGLQQTFNDIVSGIILLWERSITIGDILEIDGDVVKIESIGLRTSKGLNRDEIVIIIPNSLITTNKVINWSHQSMKTRFKIKVGVAYGSDINLVEKILIESAQEHSDITEGGLIDARLTDFGNSSIDFQLLFFSRNIFRIEKVKSDIRKIISRKFAENNISIPFPQVDVHYKSDFRENR